MVINNYNANRGDFGKDRMRLYLKKESGRNYRNQKAERGIKIKIRNRFLRFNTILRVSLPS